MSCKLVEPLQCKELGALSSLTFPAFTKNSSKAQYSCKTDKLLSAI